MASSMNGPLQTAGFRKMSISCAYSDIMEGRKCGRMNGQTMFNS